MTLATKIVALKTRIREEGIVPLSRSSTQVRSLPVLGGVGVCAHLLPDTNTTLPCPSCAGTVNLKVFGCEVYGTCTVGKPVAGTACCKGCTSYLPSVPVPHPNVTSSYTYAQSIPEYPVGSYSGRGVVVVGGGSYWASTYVTVRMLRHVGCMLPVQVWYLGERDWDESYGSLLAPYGVEFVDATAHPLAAGTRSKLVGFRGHPPFEVKSFAVLHSPFAEVLLLDADNYPCADPTVLFKDPRYRLTGGVYWPDGANTNKMTHWSQWGVPKFGPECGWEVGQYVIDKRIAWRQLNMARWYDDRGDWCYGGGSHHDHGDKGPHRVGWAMFRTEPTFYTTRVRWEKVAFLQPGPDGRTPMFIHRCRSKFVLSGKHFPSTPQNGVNLRARLPMEVEAFGYLEELRKAIP